MSTPYGLLPLDAEGNQISKEPLFRSPKALVEIGKPKSGKTRAKTNVEKMLILDFEQSSSYFEANNIAPLYLPEKDYSATYYAKSYHVPTTLLETIKHLSDEKVNNMAAFNKLRDAYEIEQNAAKAKEIKREIHDLIAEMKFPIICIDTLTNGFKNQVWHCALQNYKKTFSTNKSAQEKTDISKVDNYNGSAWKRDAIAKIKSFIERRAAPFVIYSGHIAMNRDTLSKDQEELSIPDLALEGQSKLIFTSDCDAVARFYRDSEGCFLDFKKVGDNDQGTRCPHLSNKTIKISDLDVADKNGNTEKYGDTYWHEIYPDVFG